MPVILVKYRCIYFFILLFFPQMWVDQSLTEGRRTSEVQKLETATVKPLFLQVVGLIPGKCRWALKFTHLLMGSQWRLCCCSSVRADFYLLPPRLRMFFVFQLSSVLTFLQTCFVPLKSYYRDI